MGNTVGKYFCFPSSTSNKHCKILKNSKNSSETEQQQNLQQQQFFHRYTYSNELSPPLILTCEICIEEKHIGKFFNAKNCTHFYCIECIVKYIESKLQDNVPILACPRPNCDGILEPSYCRAILPYKVFIRWEKALCEQGIPENLKFYCPFKDCSALLINDNNNNNVIITYSICPHCGRDICVNCKAPWHIGFECVRFERLKHNEEALMMDLAKRSKWRRCPNCKHYVEKRNGCDFIKCRCKHLFCYKCGQSIIKTCPHTCSRKQ
ncbi:putative E3 ubiquitin-protein ligase RNF217 [Senna tora]|uniref:RBR-type E3 ubiquitin transferase n=1 Tax=Senna tora TaxID=362788 RepID=A0A835CGA3_9FABA|nr:putative E3 ubiquitin-protein ligase RNF217 [Senna tora]